MKPNKKLLRKWVTALRSGKYHQTTGTLCKVKKGQSFHCCLGVLCRVLVKEDIGVEANKNNDNVIDFSYKGKSHDASLPDTINDLVGLPVDVESDLVTMNDNRGATFKQIADHIKHTFNL